MALVALHVKDNNVDKANNVKGCFKYGQQSFPCIVLSPKKHGQMQKFKEKKCEELNKFFKYF